MLDCSGCGAKCCGRPITDALFSLFLLPEEKEVLRAYAPDIRIKDYGPVGYFETKDQCLCLDGDKCGIYANRPLMCRCFPLILYQDAKTLFTAFDLGLCPRHDPGRSTAHLATVDATFDAFHITREEFFGLLALYYLKEVRVEDVLKSLSLRDRNHLNVKRTAIRCVEARTAIMKIRPQLPTEDCNFFYKIAQNAYNGYKQALGNHPILTREMVKIAGALMAVAARAQANEVIRL